MQVEYELSEGSLQVSRMIIILWLYNFFLTDHNERRRLSMQSNHASFGKL